MINIKKRIKFNPATKIALGFLSIILIGAFLLCLPISSNSGTWMSFIDALFTSTSAVCVTGLIVVDTAVYFSLFGQIVIMLLIQIGGLGFITLTSLMFLIIGKKISYKNRITIQESLNQDSNQGIVKLVKNIIIMVLIIEACGFICLAPSMIVNLGWGKGLFSALFLSISAFCNAGFDVLGTESTMFQNLAPFSQNVLVLLPIMLLIVIGGIGYLVLFDIGNKFKKDKKKMSFHSKIVLFTTLILIFGGAILFAIFEWNNPNTIGNMGFGDKIVNAFFQSITPRTAGFSTFDQAALTPQSRIVTNLFMFIGGSPASTAGGIKTTTFVILILSLFRFSNDKGDVVCGKKQVSHKIIQKSFKIFGIAILVICSSVLLLCVVEPTISTSAVIFEVVSAISTVGISLGITPTLSAISKMILIFLMYIGRLGVFTLSLAISSRTQKTNEEIEYPDSKIIVG